MAKSMLTKLLLKYTVKKPDRGFMEIIQIIKFKMLKKNTLRRTLLLLLLLNKKRWSTKRTIK